MKDILYTVIIILIAIKIFFIIEINWNMTKTTCPLYSEAYEIEIEIDDRIMKKTTSARK